VRYFIYSMIILLCFYMTEIRQKLIVSFLVIYLSTVR